MSQDERQVHMAIIIGVLVRMRKADVDALLRETGTASLTRAGWSGRSDSAKRLEVSRLLDECSDGRIAAVAQALCERDAALETATAVGAGSPSIRPIAASVVRPNDPIFIVHGRDHAVLHHAVRVLERGTGREVIVLHEQTNAGRTILEKFEDYAAVAAYAVVLLTGDDEGRALGENEYRRRGRQNVVFELGFFLGKLGRGGVAVLVGADVERPSDIDGLVYIAIDSAGAWKQALAKELEAVGISINYSRIP